MFPKINKVTIGYPDSMGHPFYIQISRGKWYQTHFRFSRASMARVRRIPWILDGKLTRGTNIVTWEREDGS